MPIIKSLSRKAGYFRQPVNYILKSQKQHAWILLHNMMSAPNNKEDIISEFQNHFNEYHSKNKNSVAMYHEIIAFSDLDNEILLKHPHIMEDLTREYLQRRTTGLAMAYPHFDKHPHVHILLSQNQFETSKSIRISKSEFSKIKREIEQIQLDRYPELLHSRIEKQIDQEPKQSKNLRER